LPALVGAAYTKFPPASDSIVKTHSELVNYIFGAETIDWFHLSGYGLV